MAESLTPKAHLRTPAYKQRSYHDALDDNRTRLDGFTAIGDLCVSPREVPSTSLYVQVASGRFRLADGTVLLYAGVSAQLLGDNATTCLWLDTAGALQSDVAFPATAHLPLAVVTTLAGVVTAIADRRPCWSTVLDAATGAPASAQYVTLATNATLTSERTLAVTTPLTLTDGGAGNAATIALGNTGADKVPLGNGTAVDSYTLTAGSGVTLTRNDGAKTFTIAASGAGSGTVTSVAMTLPSFLSVAGSPVTTSGTLAVTLASQSSRTFLCAPNGGGTPAFRAIETADLPAISATGLSGTVPTANGGTGQTTYSDGDILVGLTSGNTLRKGKIIAGGGATVSYNNATGEITVDIAPGVGSGTVTSVGLAVSPSWLAVSGSPITTTGTITLSAPSQAANLVLASPSGSSGAPTFRSLTTADIPALSTSILTSGTLGTARGGTGVSVASFADGEILAGVTATGLLRVGSLVGASGVSVAYDNTTGVFTISGAGAGGGSVTSVGLSMPGIFAVAGSPVTTSGTIAVTLANQSANRVLAGPTTGAAAAPTFRSLVAGDIPTITASQVSGISGTANQVIATTGTGTLVLSTPQDLHTGASPQFTGLALSGTPGSPATGTLWYNGTAKTEVLRTEGVDSRRVGTLCVVLGTQSAASASWTTLLNASRVGSLTVPAALAVAGKLFRLSAWGRIQVPSPGYALLSCTLGLSLSGGTPVLTVALPLPGSGTAADWSADVLFRLDSTTAATGRITALVDGVTPRTGVSGVITYSGSVAWGVDLQAQFSGSPPVGLSASCLGAVLEVLN